MISIKKIIQIKEDKNNNYGSIGIVGKTWNYQKNKALRGQK